MVRKLHELNSFLPAGWILPRLSLTKSSKLLNWQEEHERERNLLESLVLIFKGRAETGNYHPVWFLAGEPAGSLPGTRWSAFGFAARGYSPSRRSMRDENTHDVVRHRAVFAHRGFRKSTGTL